MRPLLLAAALSAPLAHAGGERAVMVKPFTAPVEMARAGTGLPGYLVTLLFEKSEKADAAPCSLVLVEGQNREALITELNVQKKYRRFFEKRSRAEAALLSPDFTVQGELVAGGGGYDWSVRVMDQAGQVVGTMTEHVTEETTLAAAPKVADWVASTVCAATPKGSATKTRPESSSTKVRPK